MGDARKCPSCGNEVEQGQAFCVYCGEKVAEDQSDDGLNKMPKRKNSGAIIAVIVVSVFVFATIGMLAEKYAQNQNADNVYFTDNAEEGLKEGIKEVEDAMAAIEDNSESKKEYSKGSFTSTSYVSEFIGVRFTTPENWVIVSEEELAQLPSDARTTWEMQAISALEGSNVIVAVEKLMSSNMSMDMYIDALKKNLSSDSEVAVSNMQESTPKMIAGEVYNVLSYNGTQNNVTYTHQ